MVFAKKLPREWMEATAKSDDEAEAAFNLQGVASERMSEAEIRRRAEEFEDLADAATIEEMERAEQTRETKETGEF